uniref:Tumor protein D53 isoform X2 n=1 Tax=Geotrypetes seraphini TaxID=260995 RepID=A0A6P8PTL1_GEOSA|nr:tumor protein D53 isoform X2 [Geotrypetes seraphini]
MLVLLNNLFYERSTNRKTNNNKVGVYKKKKSVHFETKKEQMLDIGSYQSCSYNRKHQLELRPCVYGSVQQVAPGSILSFPPSLRPEAGLGRGIASSSKAVVASASSILLWAQMEPKGQPDLLETQPLQEIDEDLTAEADNIQVISEEEREELKVELDKLEDEIATLRQVLAAKEKYLMEIKQKLGMNRMNELKQNFSKSWHDVQTYSAYKKTQETLSHAGQKATAAISNVGSAIGKKLGDMSYSIRHSISMPAMRNSPTFKSFEERVENTMTNFKTRVGGTGPSGGNFEEVLNSAAHASAQSSVLESRLPESEEELQC